MLYWWVARQAKMPRIEMTFAHAKKTADEVLAQSLKLQTDGSEGGLRSLFVYLHQGKQHIKISVYFDTDGEQLI